VLSDANSGTPSFEAPEGLVNSEISFELHVSDGTNVYVDTVIIEVAADDDAPSASAGSDLAVEEGERVSLGGSATDPEGGQLSYQWVQTAGPSVVLSDPTSATPSFDAPEGLVNSELSFELHVSDGSNESVDTVSVVVAADDDAPSVSAGAPQLVEEGELVSLSGTGVDPEGQELSYQWVQTSGPAVVLSDASSDAPVFEAPEGVANSEISFELHVSDGVHESVDTVSITVNADDDAPQADAGSAQSVDEGQQVVLQGAGSDQEGQDLTYQWIQTGGPVVEFSEPTGASLSFEAPEGLVNTDLTFELHVSDGTNVSVDTVIVAVAADNDAPRADAGASQAVVQGDTVSLTGAGIDPEGQELSYHWVQLSGPEVVLTDAYSPNPTFVLPAGAEAGDMVFALEVSDGENVLIDTVSVVVTQEAEQHGALEPAADDDAQLERVDPLDSDTDPDADVEHVQAVLPETSVRPDLSPLFSEVVETPGVVREDSAPTALPSIDVDGNFDDVFEASEIVLERGASKLSEADGSLADGEVNRVSQVVDRDPDGEAEQIDDKPQGFLAGLFGLVKGMAATSKKDDGLSVKDDEKDQKGKR